MKKRTKGLFTLAIAAFSTVVLAQTFTTFPQVRVQNQLDLQGTVTANGSTGTSGQVLTSNGASDVTWSTVTVPAAANPTASVGLSAVNGSAATFMRSDAAPALSQSIAPTWTGQHLFTNGSNNGSLVAQGSRGIIGFFENDATADNGKWRINTDAESLRLELLNDALNSSAIMMQFDRTGNTRDNISFTATTLTSNVNQNIFEGLTRVLDVRTSGAADWVPLSIRDNTDAEIWWLVHQPSTGDLDFQRQSGSGNVQVLGSNVCTANGTNCPGSITGFANPTASIGLTAVNGAATTAMRSDAAPALSQTIAPQWTGIHKWIGSSTRTMMGAADFNTRTVGATSAMIQVEGTGNATSSMSIVRNNASSGGGILTLGHSRANAVNGVDIVNINEALGTIDFAGADGVDLEGRAASIVAASDATPGVGDMPGRLQFNTTADGAEAPTERMRISSSGAIGLSGANFGTTAQAIVSNGSAAAPTWQTVCISGSTCLFGNGTASAPSVAFTSDTNTGIFRDTADRLSFAANGTQLGYWDETALTITDTFASIRLLSTNPTSGLTLYDDTGTTLRSTIGDNAGTLFIQKNNTGNIQIQTSSGTISLNPGGSSEISLGGPTEFTSTMRGPAGTAGAPPYSFESDTDDGIFDGGANTVSIATGGVERVSVKDAGTILTGHTQLGTSSSVGTAALRGTEIFRIFGNSQGLEFSSPGSNVFNITQHDGTFYNTLQLTANDLQFSDSGGTAVNMTPVKGNFTVDFTAQCSASTTITVEYYKIGAQVMLNVPAFSCTSTTSSLAASGTPVPSAIRPTAGITESQMIAVTDSSTNTHPGTIQVQSTGAFTINRCGTSAGVVGTCANSWNASGSKGIQGGVKTVSYLKY